MKPMLRVVLVITAASALNGCSSLNVFKDSSSTPPSNVPQPTLAPDVPAASTTLSAAQIKGLMTGKSWAWTGPKNSGVTLYASDGTSLVQVNGKGTTSGKWLAKDGQLCESFSPASFLPQGVPMGCQPFAGAAGNYKVGQATFKLAS